MLSAQPRGDEPERIRQLVNAILDEISLADEKIAKNQNDAQLYAERGKLYVKLYRTRYLTQYLSSFYREKTPDTRITTITTKAIEDFDRAIKATPNAELLKLRGEMYAIRWFDYFSSFYWRNEVDEVWKNEIERENGKEWSQIVEKILYYDKISKGKAELIILEKYLANKDFDLARKDFENALKVSANDSLTKEINENLGRLLLTRASKTSNLEFNRKLLVKPNQFDYSILDDLNQGISYLEKSDFDRTHESGDLIRHTFYENFVAQEAYWYKLPALRAAFQLKAYIAFSFGDLVSTLQALNQAEKTIDRNADGFACQLYPFRSQIYLKMNDFDAAIADANQSYRNSEPNNLCSDSDAYKIRGDAYFEKGKFKAAIANYTNQLKYTNGVILDTSLVYKKRGLAYLKLKNPQNAIADFTNALSSYSINYQPIDYQKRQIELLKLRASVYRQLGDEKNVLEDEKQIKYQMERLLEVSSNRHIFGKIKLPDTLKIDRNNIFTEIVYDSNVDKHGTPIVDENGRFDFLHLKNEPFYLYIYFDTFKDGVPLRYYGKSQRFERGEKIFGPIIINLDKFVKRNDNDR